MTFLLLSLFSFLAFASAASYENLYLIGNATTAGWTTDDGKITMTKESDGVFTWTGPLKNKADGDNGQLRFKFIVGNDWTPSITCRYNVEGHVEITSGVEVDVYEYSGGDGTFDNAFQVTETAEYKIDVNLNTMKMTVTKTGDIDPIEDKPDYNQLYIVGGALYEDANWELSGAIAMTKVEEGVFIWSGELYANTETREDGNLFKFLNTQDWANSINPDNDYEFAVDTDYNLTYKKDDKKFKVTTPGIYTIRVNLKEMKVHIVAGVIEEKPNLNELYIVGNATEAGWDPENPIEMTKVSEGVFTWTGTLSTENGNEFKFLNVKGVWRNSINPADGDIDFLVDTDYNLNYRPYEGSPNDYKFKVTTAGTYTIRVDLNEMKLRITAGTTGLPTIAMLPFEVIVLEGSFNIVTENNNKIQAVQLFDITGKNLKNENLSKGVYIIKVKYNDKEYIQKVILQK